MNITSKPKRILTNAQNNELDLFLKDAVVKLLGYFNISQVKLAEKLGNIKNTDITFMKQGTASYKIAEPRLLKIATILAVKTESFDYYDYSDMKELELVVPNKHLIEALSKYSETILPLPSPEELSKDKPDPDFEDINTDTDLKDDVHKRISIANMAKEKENDVLQDTITLQDVFDEHKNKTKFKLGESTFTDESTRTLHYVFDLTKNGHRKLFINLEIYLIQNEISYITLSLDRERLPDGSKQETAKLTFNSLEDFVDNIIEKVTVYRLICKFLSYMNFIDDMPEEFHS